MFTPRKYQAWTILEFLCSLAAASFLFFASVQVYLTYWASYQQQIDTSLLYDSAQKVVHILQTDCLRAEKITSDGLTLSVLVGREQHHYYVARAKLMLAKQGKHFVLVDFLQRMLVRETVHGWMLCLEFKKNNLFKRIYLYVAKK
jgi:hypothetical protein